MVFWRGLSLDKNTLPSTLLGQMSPDLVLPDLFNNQSVDISTYQGEVILLNVWATWCPGCLLEHDVLNSIAASDEVKIIGMNYKDDLDKAKNWLKMKGNPFIAIPIDTTGRTAIEWGVYGAPETFVIDKKGIIRYKHIAPISIEDWEKTLLPIVQALKQESI